MISQNPQKRRFNLRLCLETHSQSHSKVPSVQTDGEKRHGLKPRFPSFHKKNALSVTVAVPLTVLEERDTFKLPTLSRFRNQVSVYPDASQEQDLPLGSTHRSCPQNQGPLVQHRRLSEPTRVPHVGPGWCLSHQPSGAGSFRHECSFLKICV